MTIHYELIILYQIGFSPSELIKRFGYSRGSAYRFYRIYRDARKRACELIISGNSVSPRGKHRVNNRGEKRSKKCVSRREKVEWRDNGKTVTVRVKH